MSLMKEFREFAMKGNVVDLAVGVIIGGAFGKITTSLVNDIIMPPIGMVLGKVDFKDLKLTLLPPAEGIKEVAISYGAFINTLIDFTIVAFALFMVIKAMNTMKRKFEKQEAVAAAAPAVPPADVVLLTEIRDLLKK
jgi:large conductance mechanosensitive channel